ncbi:MAG: 5'/3'-nucleotidase SurE [Polyangiales bacterium]
MTFTKMLLAVAVLTLGTQAAPARALDILLTNDDGFESSMLQALYRRLKENGHRVLVSAPAMEQSGTGGAISREPLGPLPTPTRAGIVPAGAKGVGTLPGDPDVFYVNSTPSVSLLHGLDVLVRKRWNKAPDLVIAGPNNGHNIGLLSTHSGTFQAAMTSLARGIPSIAVSAGLLVQGFRSFTELTPQAVEYEVADVVVRLVKELERTRTAAPAKLLPVGIGLNVNIPDFLPGMGPLMRFEFSKVGTTVLTMPTFVENLALDPIMGLTLPPPLPGVSTNLTGLSPNPIERIDDTDPTSEQATLLRGRVAVSVVQCTHQADDPTTQLIRGQLNGLVNPATRTPPAAPQSPPAQTPPTPAAPTAPALRTGS